MNAAGIAITAGAGSAPPSLSLNAADARGIFDARRDEDEIVGR
jgi:hypothetical protein